MNTGDFHQDKRTRSSLRFDAPLKVSYARKGSRGEVELPYKEARGLDLSTAGVRFSADEEFAYGMPLHLKMDFRGDSFESSGKVVRCRKPEENGPCEIAAAFVGLSSAAEEKIGAWFYSGKMSSETLTADDGKPGARKSGSGRFSVTNAYCRYRRKGLFSSGGWSKGAIKELGRQGLLMLTGSGLGVGNVLQIILYLPAYDEPVRAVARVVSVVGRPGHCESVLGFVRIKKADAAKMSHDEYLQSLINRADDGET